MDRTVIESRSRRVPGKRGFCMAAWLMLAIYVAPAAAEDTVVIQPAVGREPLRVSGQIVDYNGRQLEIQVSGNIPRKFPSEQVVEVQTTYDPNHVAADALFAKQEYIAAAAKYQAALNKESRRWVRHRILAQLVRCNSAQGLWSQAGDYFLLLVKDDPETPEFAAIPLAWLASDSAGVVATKANEWLARDAEPVSVLLGASHLLLSPQGPAAVQKLQQLSGSRDVRIAALAETQLLRTSLATVDKAALARWDDRVPKFPAVARAGAYYTLGRAWRQRGDNPRAAIDLLRVPILYPNEHTLAAESLLLAAEALLSNEQQLESQRLVVELCASYPQSRAAKEARQRSADWGLTLESISTAP